MKNLQSKTAAATINRARWAAYAAAGAATALAGAPTAEAAIHYSGSVRSRFGNDSNVTRTFPLDQPGDFLAFKHSTHVFSYGPFAGFHIGGIRTAQFQFTPNFDYYLVKKLGVGENVSVGQFLYDPGYAYLAGKRAGSDYGDWTDRGTGFIAFKFNDGSGVHYGWARLRTKGNRGGNGFELLDYAWADVGESILTGQTSSEAHAPLLGSLGLLALGGVGTQAWRKRRTAPGR
jgi:hypothetical protein